MTVRKIDRGARALERSRVGGLARRLGTWRGVLVLNYHRIGSPDANGFDHEIWSATADEFDSQMALLARDFEVVGPDDLLARPRVLGRRILLTFDDGYRDNHDVALPILRSHGLTATFFVVPGFIDTPRVPWWDEVAWIVNHSGHASIDLPEHGLERLAMASEANRRASAAALLGVYKGLPGSQTEPFLDLIADRAETGRVPSDLARGLWLSWEQVRELKAAGMMLGGHSLTHPVLARLPREDQAKEIDGCAERLRAETGDAMTWFSYPVGLDGSYDRSTRDLLASAGVKLAFAFAGGYVRGSVDDPLAVPRTGVSLDVGRERFAAMVTLPRVFARW